MEKLLKYINIDSVRTLFWIIFFINILENMDYRQVKIIIVILYAIVIILNDYIRIHKNLSKDQVIISNILSTVLALAIGVLCSIDINIYICTLGCEVIFYRLKERDSLWYLNLGAYTFLIFYRGISKGIISKSEELVKKSIVELRATVYDLREYRNETFIGRLTSVIENVKAPCNIEVDLDCSNNIEKIGFEIKDLIYRTIQECITNSLNHGKADKIIIKLLYENNCLNFSIKDNGKGCKVLIENNSSLIPGKINREIITPSKAYKKEFF